MKAKLLLLFLLAGITSAFSLSAQSGTIRGKVVDGENAEPMMSATIRLLQNGQLVKGTQSDLDGLYQFVELQAGSYTLLLTYISYDSVYQDLEVTSGHVTTVENVMNLHVEDDENSKNKVVITERKEVKSDIAVDLARINSINVADGMGATQMGRTGDSDAGAASARIVGANVEGGKYVYVRGLGDRYSKTMLNGSEIPGLDPDRNSVQMDLFPTNLIDNIMVYKTFTPDLPGNFTGGLVQITTKDFPSKFTLQYSSSFGYNTQSSFRSDFLSGQNGKTDWLGFDDGTRDMPAILSGANSVPEFSSTFGSTANTQQLSQASKSFTTAIYPEKSSSFMDQSHSFSAGNQSKLFGRELGYIFSISYSNNYTHYDDGVTARYKLTTLESEANGLTLQQELRETTSNRDVLVGSLANISYKINDKHRIGINLMHNHSGTSSGRYFEGPFPADDPNLIFQTRVVQYRQRQLNTAQIKGAHVFGGDSTSHLRVEWVGAATLSSQDEPDLRFFSNDYTIFNEDTLYNITEALYNNPGRYFRHMNESNLDGKLDFELPFRQWSGLRSRFKFGGSALQKDRTFTERRFEFEQLNLVQHYDGDPASFWDNDNLGTYQDSSGNTLWSMYLQDASEKRNQYTGSQSIYAAYAMTELPLAERLRFIAGARFEKTNIQLISQDPKLARGNLDNNDLLPSANLIYALRNTQTNKMNLRASFTRTLARPTFRELAPFASFDFVRDFTLIGNPNLKRTRIDNYDLRWEWMPSLGEILSVSAFYKHFQNPIERVINPTAVNLELNYRNVPEATVYGLEFEAKKSLAFMGNGFRNFRVGANFTLIRSFLDIDPQELTQIRVLNPSAPARRAMYGQSPYTINADLTYINDTLGLMMSLNFNVWGDRISDISSGGTPNVYERSRPQLDYTISQNISSRWSIRFRARNLFNPENRRTYRFHDQDFTFQSFRTGRVFSLGITYAIK